MKFVVRLNYPAGVPAFLQEDLSNQLPRPGTASFHTERTEVGVTVEARTLPASLAAALELLGPLTRTFFGDAEPNALEAATETEANNRMLRSTV